MLPGLLRYAFGYCSILVSRKFIGGALVEWSVVDIDDDGVFFFFFLQGLEILVAVSWKTELLFPTCSSALTSCRRSLNCFCDKMATGMSTTSAVQNHCLEPRLNFWGDSSPAGSLRSVLRETCCDIGRCLQLDHSV